MKSGKNNNSYAEYVERISPPSHVLRDCLRAFWVGGVICCIGQSITLLLSAVLPEKEAACWSSILLVFLGALLTGIGLYAKIGKYAGAGSIVPITGFSNSIVASAIEFKQEGLVMGVGSKLFTVAGPVLVYGISASVIAGGIYYLRLYLRGAKGKPGTVRRIF